MYIILYERCDEKRISRTIRSNHRRRYMPMGYQSSLDVWALFFT